VIADVESAYSSTGAGRIDLFTQKIPFNGKGTNERSDAFQPQELVILFANVTYNEYPLANKLVAFQINNPVNAIKNFTIVGVSVSNESGVAQFSFRIPGSLEDLEQTIFGEWSSVATVDIAEQVVNDTLTFNVGWIIEITDIASLNTNLEPQTKYEVEEQIFFNLTIENIALIPKLATIMVDVQDAADAPIIHIQLNNLVCQAGTGNVLMSSEIPLTAAIGGTMVSATAHTAPPELGGVPYSPATLSTFEIIAPSAKQYYLTVKTDPNNVTAISGQGWYEEGANAGLIAPQHVSASSGSRYRFDYWDVDGINQSTGVYQFSVYMDANHTATAHYVYQYYLSITTNPSSIATPIGEGWYDIGTDASIATPDYAQIVSNVLRYRFNDWTTNDISEITDPLATSTTVLMDKPKTVTANYVMQYYLAMMSLYGTGSGEGWYDTGATAYASLNTGLVDHANGTRRAFVSWSGDASGTNYAQSNAILMNSPKTAYANWKTQYYLTINTDPPRITSIAGEGWYDESANVTLNAPPVVNYSFRYWSVNGESRGERVNPITVQMNAPKNATAHYALVTICSLTIVATAGGTTDPAPGVYTYTIGSTAQVRAIPNRSYVFDHWELDGSFVGSANPFNVLMDRNHTLKAVFSPAAAGWFVPDWLYWFVPLLLLLIMLLLIPLWLYRRRRRREQASFYSGWTAWYYGYDLRKVRRI
jgi:hypothetical protein